MRTWSDALFTQSSVCLARWRPSEAGARPRGQKHVHDLSQRRLFQPLHAIYGSSLCMMCLICRVWDISHDLKPNSLSFKVTVIFHRMLSADAVPVILPPLKIIYALLIAAPVLFHCTCPCTPSRQCWRCSCVIRPCSKSSRTNWYLWNVFWETLEKLIWKY